MVLHDIFINIYCLFPILPPPRFPVQLQGFLSILFITLSLVSRTVAGIKEVTVNIYRKEGREGRRRKEEGGREGKRKDHESRTPERVHVRRARLSMSSIP